MFRRALVLCRYSGELFYSDNIIMPHWSAVPFHPRSLATVIGIPVLSAVCFMSIVSLRRRSAGKDRNAASAVNPMEV
jgi:hypothetical protein